MNDQAPSTAVAQRVAGGAIIRASELRDHVNLIQEVMTSVMKAGVHYGTIPGAGDKPALFLPGAEILAVAFRLATDPAVEDLSAGGILKYRVRMNLRSMDGRIVGTGIGEASSDEEKYAWRKAICKEEWESTLESQRRLRWRKGWKDNPPSADQQIRTNSSDIGNTVLKMAKKRAFVDAVRMTTGCSDVFEQDVEDLPEEILQREAERDAAHHPGKAAAAKAEAEVTPEQRAKVVAVLEAQIKAGVPIESCWALMGKADRVAVGKAEWERLRKIAATAKAEKAPTGAPSASSVPAVDSQGAGASAQPAQPGAGSGAKTADGWGEEAFSDVKEAGREPGE